jgi:hypothetical protein
MAEVDDRADDRGVCRILEHVKNEALVDLQFMNRKA